MKFIQKVALSVHLEMNDKLKLVSIGEGEYRKWSDA